MPFRVRRVWRIGRYFIRTPRQFAGANAAENRVEIGLELDRGFRENPPRFWSMLAKAFPG